MKILLILLKFNNIDKIEKLLLNKTVVRLILFTFKLQKQETINQLNNELGQLNGELAQVEAKVNELLNYTNDRTNEITGGK